MPSTPTDLHFGFTPGDVVLVSGAGSGIGQAVAHRATRLGLTVAAWDLDERTVVETVAAIRETGGTAHAIVADVGDDTSVERGFAETTRHLGAVRYLVNNAGPSAAVELSFDDGVRAGVGSVRRMTETWLSGSPPSGSAVVNVASVAGNFLGTGSEWYSATKAAIGGYTRHLATYRAGEARCNAVAPGMVDTPRLAGFAASEVGRRALDRNPLGRMATPDDVAYATLFLLSPPASYINGAMLPVDGGWLVTQ